MELPGFCPVHPNPEQSPHRRHLRTQDVKHAGDFLTGRRTLLMNDDVRVGVCKIAEKPGNWFANGEGDECWFAYDGGGTLESVYGILPFRKHDYVIIPKTTPYRIHPEGNRGTFLVIESASSIDVPKQFRNESGQVTMDGPYGHRDFRAPTELLKFDRSRHGDGPYPLIVKLANRLSVHEYKHFPWELAGWDGFSYPVAFNIHDYQPRTGTIHLPPTIHITFAGRGSSFAASCLERSITIRRARCGRFHAPTVMRAWTATRFFITSTATSPAARASNRSPSACIRWACRMGRIREPTRKAWARSRTSELAVMCDTFKPLLLTPFASTIEDQDYHYTWVSSENESMETSK